jgi:L-ribulose-5-phosphate 4-epimerase
MSGYAEIREECCRANRSLPTTGLVDLTFGNVSVSDPVARVFAIKPSGVDYGILEPSHMVIVDFEGRVVEGSLRPSSDTPTHLRLLKSFAGVRSIVHTHSRYAVSFAQAGREIPCLGTTHADYFHGAVPVTRSLTDAEIQGDYEAETGQVILERFRSIDPLEVPAVLVCNHGPFAWGPTGENAVEMAQALEIVAQMAYQALQISPSAPVIPKALADRHFYRKHGPGGYYGQSKGEETKG